MDTGSFTKRCGRKQNEEDKASTSSYWVPKHSAFVPKRLRGKPLGEFLRFEDAKAKALELTTPEAPLLWGVAPWVKADYGWLPPDEKPTEWHIQTHCSSLD
jgi:hypothetical protein